MEDEQPKMAVWEMENAIFQMIFYSFGKKLEQDHASHPQLDDRRGNCYRPYSTIAEVADLILPSGTE